MNWKNPEKDLPKEGEIVAVLFQHWKEHKPLSCEILFGEVEYYDEDCTVQTNDMTGMGSYNIKLKGKSMHGENILAWISSKEFELPSWIPHDPWWK